MDKICRNSRVGDAHNEGNWTSMKDLAQHSRPRGAVPVPSLGGNKSPSQQFRPPPRDQASDTFRSQGWFRHDGAGTKAEVAQLSNKFWLHAKAYGPAGAAVQPPTTSRPMEKNGGGHMRAERAEGSAGVRDATSPNFRTSEDWMGYGCPTSPPQSPREGRGAGGVAAGAMSPRTKEAGATSPRAGGCRGAVSPRAGGGAGSPRPPPNVKKDGHVTLRMPSREMGKSTTAAPGGSNASPGTEDRGRLSKKPPTGLPLQSARAAEVIASHPNLTTGSCSTGNLPAAPPRRFGCTEQRTSAEMSDSMMPHSPELLYKRAMEASPRQDNKYFVGDELVSWQKGRRSVATCRSDVGIAPGIALPVQNFRDHYNSDAVRSHLQPAVGIAATGASQEWLLYGGGDSQISSLPSSLAKDVAYEHAGMRLVGQGRRSPGAYSPHMPRVPITHAMVR